MASYYNPENPKKGDLVFISDSWTLDLMAPEKLESQCGIISDRLDPDIKGGIRQYKLDVKLANGTTTRIHSRDCKCLQQVQRSTQAHLDKQNEIIHRLEIWRESICVKRISQRISPPPQDPGPDME